MTFKNAFKILITKFSLIWVLLLYTFVGMVIVVGISLPFITSIYKNFSEAGIIDNIYSMIMSFYNGASLQATYQSLTVIVGEILTLFSKDIGTLLTSTIFLVFVVGFLFKVIIGLYEVALSKIINAFMSSNTKISYFGNFISSIGMSIKYVLLHSIIALAYDLVMTTILTFASALFKVNILSYFAPFLLVLIFIVLLTIKSTLLSLWTAGIVIEDKPLVSSFKLSLKVAFSKYGTLFTVYFVFWLLTMTVTLIVCAFTFGVGIIITVPMAMLFANIIAMVFYYNVLGRRYYLDTDTVYTPRLTVTSEK